MKERLGIKDSIFVLKSLLSPFGAVRLRPLDGVSIELKNTPDPEAPGNLDSTIDEKGHVVVPTGGSAKVIARQGENTNILRIEDYRERPRRIPGAKITGEGVDIDMNSEKRREPIPGIGNLKYYK